MVDKKRVLRLRDPPPRDPEHVFNDTNRIVGALYVAGYVVTYRAAKTAWSQYSEAQKRALGWPVEPSAWISVLAYSDTSIVDILLHGGGLKDGRQPGPFLVDTNTGEEVKDGE